MMLNRKHGPKVALAAAFSAGFLAFASTSVGDSGYLTSIGPAEVRFSAPLRPAPSEFLALIAQQAKPPVNIHTNTAPAIIVTNQPDPATNAVVTVSKSPDPINQTPTQMTPVVGAVPSEDTISPQMLVPFFNSNKSRRGNDGGVIVPVNMAPGPMQQPAALPSSKATYTNGPETPR